MIDLNLDMRQYDCPFIDTTSDDDIAFSAVQWRLDTDAAELETRLVAHSPSRAALEAGLHTLRDHPNMRKCRILSKSDAGAVVSTVIEETDAMRTITRNGGYITGPFHVEDGSERWHVGFDDEDDENRTLAELDRANDFTVECRDEFAATALFDLVENADSARRLFDGCRSLTETELETLTVAADNGYFEAPRGATLEDLAAKLDVSKTAVSMNVRRAERKLVHSTLSALSDLDADPP